LYSRLLGLRADGPFASKDGHPYYENLIEIIEDVAGFGNFHGWSDARQSTAQFFLWRYAGRFAKLGMKQDGEVDVHLEGDALPNLRLSGRHVLNETKLPFHVPAKKKHSISGPPDARRLELALVGDGDEIVDVFRADLINPVARVTGQDELLRTCLMEGESAYVEFKPFVGLRADGKWEEVLETALGMSNARGGTIIFGVNNHGVPKFDSADAKVVALRGSLHAVQGAVSAEQRTPIYDTIMRYASELRDSIQRHASKSLALSPSVAWSDSSPVLILAVEEGQEPPYVDIRNNNIWYRTNATNRRASEAELAEMFKSRRRQS
jgi:hypothetical protein